MINLFKVHAPADLDAPLLATLHSGYITQGQRVEEFEKAFGDYIGNPLVVSLNSCTSALTLALKLANVKRNDEVITTPMTCSATNLPILQFGAKPVFADIDPDTGLIDPSSVEKLITPKTKAIMCCDWGGTPCDLDELRRIADSHKLVLIEDAAHAMGAEYKGRKVGSIADFTCFSLQAIKHITTGDGGMLACRKTKDYERARLLRWFGIKREADSPDSRISEDIKDPGYKFHMNDLSATLGIEQMKHVERIVASYRANALYYNRTLPAQFLKLPTHNNKSSYWVYTVILPNKVARDKFVEYMNDKGIQVSQVHRRNDDYTVFKPYKRDLPGVTKFSRTMVCLPCHWALTAEDVALVVKHVNRFLEEFRQWF